MYYNNIIYSTSILITNICTCTCICNIKFSDYMYMYMYEEWSSLISCAFGMEAPQGVFFQFFYHMQQRRSLVGGGLETIAVHVLGR